MYNEYDYRDQGSKNPKWLPLTKIGETFLLPIRWQVTFYKLYERHLLFPSDLSWKWFLSAPGPRGRWKLSILVYNCLNVTELDRLNIREPDCKVDRFIFSSWSFTVRFFFHENRKFGSNQVQGLPKRRAN